jgi:hypothetical protein
LASLILFCHSPETINYDGLAPIDVLVLDITLIFSSHFSFIPNLKSRIPFSQFRIFSSSRSPFTFFTLLTSHYSLITYSPILRIQTILGLIKFL